MGGCVQDPPAWTPAADKKRSPPDRQAHRFPAPQCEQKYLKELLQLLTPLVGAGNFTARGAADVDSDEIAGDAANHSYDKASERRCEPAEKAMETRTEEGEEQPPTDGHSRAREQYTAARRHSHREAAERYRFGSRVGGPAPSCSTVVPRHPHPMKQSNQYARQALQSSAGMSADSQCARCAQAPSVARHVRDDGHEKPPPAPRERYFLYFYPTFFLLLFFLLLVFTFSLFLFLFFYYFFPVFFFFFFFFFFSFFFCFYFLFTARHRHASAPPAVGAEFSRQDQGYRDQNARSPRRSPSPVRTTSSDCVDMPGCRRSMRNITRS